MDQQHPHPVAPAVDPLSDPAQLILHRLGRPGLGDVPRDAELIHQRLVAGHRADQHRDVGGRGPRSQLLEDLPTVLHGKHSLHDEQVGQNLHRLSHRLVAVEGVRHPKANPLDLRRHPLATGGVVFDHQYQR